MLKTVQILQMKSLKQIRKTNKIKESLPELNAKIKRKEEKLKLSKFMFNYTIYYINA